jgi:translation initiation factor 1 (eIF-1/SUI1)
MPRNENPTVWSSDQGDVRKKSAQPADIISLPPQQQTLYLHRDSKGRSGKVVSLLKGLVLSEADLTSLARQM